MLNRKFLSRLLTLILSSLPLLTLTGCNNQSPTLTADIKEASRYTIEANQSVYNALDFTDQKEIENAKRGLVYAPDHLELQTANGVTAWSQEIYNFVKDKEAPNTANPSLWRNTQLNTLYGLFKVTDDIYQVRGYDIANITFVRSNTGWIVFDCSTNIEASKAALELLEQELKSDVHLSAIVISHAHIDHFGGIGGLVSEADIADATQPLEAQLASGKTLIIVPEGFEKAAMEENVFAGNAMKRRSNFQYGSLLEKSETGSLAVGIGLTASNGTTSYISPTFEVTEPVFTMTVDGLELIFQLTPGTESPAEMNTYIPQYKALWMAENCTGTMHNLYTLRGAEVRDGNAWSNYIMEAKALFGDEVEVVFQSHNWPHWGNEEINDYLVNTAAIYKYIFAQTLQYMNEGYTSTEIANKIELPTELDKIWYTRPYYGTLKHNVKAVYQKYMGWYDANPIHLDELEPTEYAKKMVSYLGDTDKVLQKAQKDFEAGEYQWVAEVTNMIVFAEPENTTARYLCADALEQLGYQAESGAWRNAYLNAAYELRYGTENYPDTIVGGTGAAATGMSVETMLDYLGICLDEKKLENENLIINLELTDLNEQYLLRIHNGVLLFSKEEWSDTPDATIRMKQLGILGIAQNNKQLMDACIESVEGQSDIINLLTSNLAKFDPYFNIIEP